MPLLLEVWFACALVLTAFYALLGINPRWWTFGILLLGAPIVLVVFIVGMFVSSAHDSYRLAQYRKGGGR